MRSRTLVRARQSVDCPRPIGSNVDHASKIGLEGLERRVTGAPVLTVTQRVELLLRVGQRPDLLLTSGAKVPQVGRYEGDSRIWHGVAAPNGERAMDSDDGDLLDFVAERQRHTHLLRSDRVERAPLDR